MVDKLLVWIGFVKNFSKEESIIGSDVFQLISNFSNGPLDMSSINHRVMVPIPKKMEADIIEHNEP